MSPNDFLTSKGYTKPNYVTQSRKIVCELLNEYADIEYKNAFKEGYDKAQKEQDTFAINFGKQLNFSCDTTNFVDLWYYYKDGKTYKLSTSELLKIFKDEAEKEN